MSGRHYGGSGDESDAGDAPIEVVVQQVPSEQPKLDERRASRGRGGKGGRHGRGGRGRGARGGGRLWMRRRGGTTRW